MGEIMRCQTFSVTIATKFVFLPFQGLCKPAAYWCFDGVDRIGITLRGAVLRCIYGFYRIQKPLYCGRGGGRMQQAEGDGIFPVHGHGSEKRMNIAPVIDRHHHIRRVFALVEHVDAEKIEIHNADLWVVLHQLVPHPIKVTVPAAANHEEVFLMQIGRVETIP